MRDIKNLPFCWQEKKALSLIRDNFKKSQLPLAISLYTTITEQASYFGKDTFNVFGIKLIEQSGIGYKSYREIMNKFIELNIIKYKKGELYKIPLTQNLIYSESEITLLQICLVQPCTKPCTKPCTHSGQSYKELKEENKEELKENIINTIPANAEIVSETTVGKNIPTIDDSKKLVKTNMFKDYAVDIEKIYNWWQLIKKVDSKWKQNRKLDDNIKKILVDVLKNYNKNDIEIAVTNYRKDIASRKKDISGYCDHRFTLQEFFTQKNGFKKFYNLI